LKYNLKKIQFSNLNETADFEAQQKKIWFQKRTKIADFKNIN
jgi:hypothetical protein